MEDRTTDESGTALTVIGDDGTARCERCELPLMPIDRDGATVTLECANRHLATAPLPADHATRRLAEGWIARRGAQIAAQRERRAAEDP